MDNDGKKELATLTHHTNPEPQTLNPNILDNDGKEVIGSRKDFSGLRGYCILRANRGYKKTSSLTQSENTNQHPSPAVNALSQFRVFWIPLSAQSNLRTTTSTRSLIALSCIPVFPAFPALPFAASKYSCHSPPANLCP